MAFQTFNFVVGYYILNDVSIVDIAWGLMFLIPNGMLLSQKKEIGTIHLLVISSLTLWAARLSMHIGGRKWREGWKEDYRYIAMREKVWSKWGGLAPLAGFLHVFALQGLFSMWVNASAMHIMRYASAKDKLGFWEIAGAHVWLIGFLMEMAADKQLQAFRDDPTNKGKIITTGLWRYSRHPNYFGEAVCWWGISIIACGGTSGKNGGIYTMLSAAFITYLLRYVSGVSMLEVKQKRKPEFRVYMKETNAFIPWFASPIPEGRERETAMR